MADITTHQDYLLEYERWLEDGESLLKTFTDPTFQGTKLRFLRHIAQDKLFVAARTGNVTAIASHDANVVANPLLGGGQKMIMGKVVGESSAPITKETLKPAQDDVRKFKSDVQDLYNGFPGLKDKDILSILSKPNGVTLLRGVAIKAGVDNAESIGTEDMDIAFFADIRKGIKENTRSKEMAATLEEKLADNDADADEEETPAPAPKKAAAKKAVAPKKAAAKKAVLDDDDEEDAQ